MLTIYFTRYNIVVVKENKYMKLATNKWNISEVGKNKPALYYGFKLKKEAQAFVDNWNKTTNLKLKLLNINKQK